MCVQKGLRETWWCACACVLDRVPYFQYIELNLLMCTNMRRQTFMIFFETIKTNISKHTVEDLVRNINVHFVTGKFRKFLRQMFATLCFSLNVLRFVGYRQQPERCQRE